MRRSGRSNGACREKWIIGLIGRWEFLADGNRGAMKSANNC
jgi:hypothetical protein